MATPKESISSGREVANTSTKVSFVLGMTRIEQFRFDSGKKDKEEISDTNSLCFDVVQKEGGKAE